MYASRTTQFIVGIFGLVGIAALSVLAFTLGRIPLIAPPHYTLYAMFDNVSGLKVNDAVQIAGVKVGKVTAITLSQKNGRSRVAMQIGRWCNGRRSSNRIDQNQRHCRRQVCLHFDWRWRTAERRPRQLSRELRRTELRSDRPGVELARVRIPRSIECEHFLITGATGVGKSMAIRSLLRQIQARGDIAIMVDPECEYVSEFYRPVRGDLILNPVDERCPYWSPWLELSERYYQADAATLAASLIPEPPRGYETGQITSSGNPAGRCSKACFRSRHRASRRASRSCLNSIAIS
jgi:Type IV secretion-system coupling protein DNA-binding domain/MlaD protein